MQSTHLDLSGALALPRGRRSTVRAAQGLECYWTCSRLPVRGAREYRPELNQLTPTPASAPQTSLPWPEGKNKKRMVNSNMPLKKCGLDPIDSLCYKFSVKLWTSCFKIAQVGAVAQRLGIGVVLCGGDGALGASGALRERNRPEDMTEAERKDAEYTGFSHNQPQARDSQVRKWKCLRDKGREGKREGSGPVPPVSAAGSSQERLQPGS